MPNCSLCLTQIPHHAAFCHRCSDSLQSTTSRCHSCGIELATSNTHCGECLSHPPEFDRTFVAGRYALPIDQLIHQFKYNGDLNKGRILAEWLSSALPLSKPDLLIPMPLSPARLQERGFNQSAELARLLSQRLQIPRGIRSFKTTQQRDTTNFNSSAKKDFARCARCFIPISRSK